MRFLDEHYGIRKDGNTLMNGNSYVIEYEKGDMIRGKRFRGTKGLWELLTHKNVIRDVITNSDLKRYKNILEMTNAHLMGYKSGGDVQISRESKFTKVISKLFSKSRRRTTLRVR